MTEVEYAELLQLLRQRLQDVGRPDLDELAFATVETAERPSDAVLNYLDAILQQVRLESREGVNEASRRLNQVLSEADAGFVDDIILAPADSERIALRSDFISLRDALPERGAFVADLQALVTDLRRDRDQQNH